MGEMYPYFAGLPSPFMMIIKPHYIFPIIYKYLYFRIFQSKIGIFRLIFAYFSNLISIYYYI
ncbi:hypothetical protein AKG09_00400 [Neisseria sp. 83E34]|nr:hypothetical protein AKG09_00400 [Neisseria sp. 83E34]